MKPETGFVLFILNLVAQSVANDFLGDDYVQEDPRDAILDRLRLLGRYAYGKGENRRDADDKFENWKGRWMPDRPDEPAPPSLLEEEPPLLVRGSTQPLHGVPMGTPSASCDDAKTNLTVDWDGSAISYTCYDKKLTPNRQTIPIKYCEHVPKSYVATHKCMYEPIEYDDDIPLYGPHRPLWPVYGEYKFLPKQRWIHSLEHGAIVALYHPCANPLEVKRLKKLVAGCLRRHVVSPYDLLSPDRPLALVAWGCRMTMSYVTPELVTEFVRWHALRGPENIARDGDFRDGLLYPAETVSDLEDTILCPRATV